MKNCHSQGIRILFCKCLRYCWHQWSHALFPYFVKYFINVTFCYTADKFASGKNIVSEGKVMENEIFKIMATPLHLNLNVFQNLHKDYILRKFIEKATVLALDILQDNHVKTQYMKFYCPTLHRHWDIDILLFGSLLKSLSIEFFCK